FLAPNITKPFEDGRRGRRTRFHFRARFDRYFQSQQQSDRGSRNHRRDQINRERPVKNRVNYSAQYWPKNCRQLKNSRSPGNGILKMLFANKMRKNRAARWPVEGPDDSEQNQHGVNRENRARPKGRQNQKKNKTQTKPYVAANQDFAAVENVGDVTRQEEEHDAGEELRQADEAEVE